MGIHTDHNPPIAVPVAAAAAVAVIAIKRELLLST
jgi:hypothetical protein